MFELEEKTYQRLRPTLRTGGRSRSRRPKRCSAKQKRGGVTWKT